VFDLNDTIEMVIPTDSGDRTCEMNHPTDEQWTARYNKRYTLIRNLGNGLNEQKQMNKEQADSALLLEIQINKAVVFDEYEAVTLMDQLSQCDVVDVIRTGGSMKIILNTILGDVEHYVKIPKQKDLKYTIDASVKMRGGRLNTSTVYVFLPPAGELYNTIAERIEGYSTKDFKVIPLIHKYKVIDAIQGEMSNISSSVKSKGGVTPHPTNPGLPSQE
jgi:hypothetical protein